MGESQVCITVSVTITSITISITVLTLVISVCSKILKEKTCHTKGWSTVTAPKSMWAIPAKGWLVNHSEVSYSYILTINDDATAMWCAVHSSQHINYHDQITSTEV